MSLPPAHIPHLILSNIYMGTFLLLLIIFFVIIPLVRVGWRVWQFQSRVRHVQREMRRAAEAAAGRGRGDADPRSPRRRKKIDPTVGEYVAFEEVVVTDTTATAAPDTVATEPQVEDADWEDVR